MKIAWTIFIPQDYGPGGVWHYQDKYRLPNLVEFFEEQGHQLVILEYISDLHHLQGYDLVILGNTRNDLFKYIYPQLVRYTRLKLMILPFTYCTDYIQIRPALHDLQIIQKRVFPYYSPWYQHAGRVDKHSVAHFGRQFYLPLLRYSLDQTMSRVEFCQKYGLDPQQKIITFFDGRFDDTWFSDNSRRHKFYRVHETIRQILAQHKPWKRHLAELGYQLIHKEHRQFNHDLYQDEWPQLNRDLGINPNLYDSVPLISDLDYPSLLRHTDLGIIPNMSTVQYPLYMYRIPCIYVDLEEYESSWRRYAHENFIRFFKGEFKGIQHADLQYGVFCTPEVLLRQPEKILQQIQELPSPEEYQYWAHHPMYGDSAVITPQQYLHRLVYEIEHLK